MKWLIVLVIAAVGAGPTTRPTTVPSTQPNPEAERELRKRIATAIHAHELIVGMTLAEANQSLGWKSVQFSDDARAWSVTVDRFGHLTPGSSDSSPRPSHTETAVAIFNADNRITAQGMLRYGDKTHNLRDKLLDWEREQKSGKSDPIDAAILEHKIIRGMTEPQADRSMEGSHKQVTETDEARVITYQFGFPAYGTTNGLGTITREVHVVFVSGKVVQFKDERS